MLTVRCSKGFNYRPLALLDLAQHGNGMRDVLPAFFSPKNSCRQDE